MPNLSVLRFLRCAGVKYSCTQHVRRYISQAPSLITLNNDKKDVTIVSMNKPPVNSLNLELLTELKITIEKIEDERKSKGLILTSSLPNVFSAGLDIMEMYKPDPERLRMFWRTLQDVFLAFYGSNLVTAAAINGNSPAGGCLLSLTCDTRVMAEGKFGIGLNETKLGIVAPFWFQDIFKDTIGMRQADRALQLGYMFSADEALKIGLVDELCPKEQVVDVAYSHMEKFFQVPGAARAITKQQLHDPIISKLSMKQEDDIEMFVTFITNSSVQSAMGKYLEALKNKQAKS